MVAQKQIAKALGISAVTVSRALRNHPDLAHDTRERILRKAQDLGYPHLRTSQARPAIKRLGILLYEVAGETEQSPFWMSDAEVPRKILASLHKEAQRNGIETVFETPDPVRTPLMVQNRTVDAVIVMGRYEPKTLAHVRNLPAVSVSSYIANDWLARVVVDNFRGMQMATEHLIALGHQKILFLEAEGGGWSELHRERQRGYAFAMYSHGLVPDAVVCPGWDIAPATERVLAATAIVASGDPLARSVQTLLLQKGKSLPQDCGIASFDGNNDAAKWDLTTYTPDWALLGKTAVDFISNCSQSLAGNGLEITVPGRLEVRGSSQSV